MEGTVGGDIGGSEAQGDGALRPSGEGRAPMAEGKGRCDHGNPVERHGLYAEVGAAIVLEH